ncbi:DgyrCDS10582 [Dimorphilus gyrociliatus]|uniref:DgyrCDS10582 n=1 Tax=Dimorphilus gyrociliatus TaxID=2664684 RepID=A0A7I8W371_9ANNE|nr:DgyrCDS10582 [Dimorphilus gyrociliatus]
MKDEKLVFGDELRFKQNILNYISNYVLKLKMEEGSFDIYFTVYMDFGYTYRMYKLYYPGSCLDSAAGEEFNKVKFRATLKKALLYTRDYVLNKRHPLVSINGFVELSLTSGNIRCEAYTLDITEEHRKLNRPIFSPNLITIEPISEGSSSQETTSRGLASNGKKVIRPNSSGVLLETFEGTSPSPETVNGGEEVIVIPKEIPKAASSEQRPLNPPIATANRKGSTIVIALPTDYNAFDNGKQNRITNVPHVRTNKKSNDKNIIPIPKKKNDTSPKPSSPQVIINTNISKDNYSYFRKIPGTSIIARKIPKSSLKAPVTEFRITEKTKNKTTVDKEAQIRTKKSSTVIDFIHDPRILSSGSNSNTEDENNSSNNVAVDESDNETVVTRISVQDKDKSSKATNSDNELSNSNSKTPFIRVDLGKLKNFGTTDKSTVKTTTKTTTTTTTTTTTKKKVSSALTKSLNSNADHAQNSELDTTAILYIEDLEDGDETESNNLSLTVKTKNFKVTPFTCPYPICNKVFFLRRSRADHVKKVHKKDIINCTFCSSVFCWQTDYGIHFLEEHKNEVALVEKGCCCGRYFNGKILLRDHLWKTHYAKGYKCSICSQKFQQTEIEPLRHHLMRHTNYMCALCGQEESNPKEYIKHFKNGHPGKTILYSCFLCSALLEEAALELHYMTKHCTKSIDIPKALDTSGSASDIISDKLRKWYNLKDCSIDVRPVDKPKIIQATYSSNREINLESNELFSSNMQRNNHCSCQCTDECSNLESMSFYQHILDTKLREKTCQLCQKSEEAVKPRALVPLEPKKFACLICGDKIDNVGRHFFEKHFKDGVTCPVCNAEVLETFSLFVSHLRTAHQPTKVKDYCPFCCCSISNNEHFKLFHSDRRNIGFYKCVMCKEYIESYYMGYHYLQHHCKVKKTTPPEKQSISKEVNALPTYRNDQSVADDSCFNNIEIEELDESSRKRVDEESSTNGTGENSKNLSDQHRVNTGISPAIKSKHNESISKRLRPKASVKRRHDGKIIGPKSAKQRKILIGERKD